MWIEVVVACLKILSPWWPGGIEKRQTIIGTVSTTGGIWKRSLPDTRLSVTTTSTVVWTPRTQTFALFCRLMTFVRRPLALDPVDIIYIFCVAQQLNSVLGRLTVEVYRSHKIRYPTPGRTLLKEWSARRRGRLPTHNKHKRRTFMPSAGFEPVIPAIERPHGHRNRRVIYRRNVRLSITSVIM